MLFFFFIYQLNSFFPFSFKWMWTIDEDELETGKEREKQILFIAKCPSKRYNYRFCSAFSGFFLIFLPLFFFWFYPFHDEFTVTLIEKERVREWRGLEMVVKNENVLNLLFVIVTSINIFIWFVAFLFPFFFFISFCNLWSCSQFINRLKNGLRKDLRFTFKFWKQLNKQ